jgi:hypothetical protein
MSGRPLPATAVAAENPDDARCRLTRRMLMAFQIACRLKPAETRLPPIPEEAPGQHADRRAATVSRDTVIVLPQLAATQAPSGPAVDGDTRSLLVGGALWLPGLCRCGPSATSQPLPAHAGRAVRAYLTRSCANRGGSFAACPRLTRCPPRPQCSGRPASNPVARRGQKHNRSYEGVPNE